MGTRIPFNRLIAAIVRGHRKYADRIHEDLIETTAAGLHQELIDLIAAGDDDAVLARLNAGVPIQALNNKHGPSLTFWASVYRRHRLIEPLLAAGVDPLRQGNWDPKTIRGSNPFGVPVLRTPLFTTPQASLVIASSVLGLAIMVSENWNEGHQLLFHFPGSTSAGVATGRAAITVPIIAKDDPQYPDAMAALSALLRAGVDASAPLVYALIAGRADVVRVVVDSARDKEHLAQYISLAALHQDFLPPRQDLRDIVDIWTRLPRGPEELLSPKLFHMAARAHSIDFLSVLVDHARTAGVLNRLINTVGHFEPYEGIFRPLLDLEDLEALQANTALTEAILASHSEWALPDSKNVRNSLRVVDLLLEAGADPGPALAMMDSGWPNRRHSIAIVRDTAMGKELLVRVTAYKSRQDIRSAITDAHSLSSRKRRM